MLKSGRQKFCRPFDIKIVLIISYCAVFCNFTVGAVDGVGTGFGVPTYTFFNGIPLFFSPFKGNARKILTES